MCKSDPAFTQYSFAEFASKILGHVSLARHRRRRPSVFPVIGIEEDLVREGELALGIPAPDVLPVGSAGLGEPIVEEASAAPADPVEDPVEDALAPLVFVEAQIEEVMQEAAGLRKAE